MNRNEFKKQKLPPSIEIPEGPLFEAVRSNDFHLMEKLLAAGEDIDSIAGFYKEGLAAEVRSLEMLDFLFDAGLTLDRHVLDEIIIRVKDPKWAYRGVTRWIQESGLSMHGKVHKEWANAYSDYSPISVAIAWWNVEAVRALLDAGYDVNFPYTRDLWRPLHFAAKEFGRASADYVKKRGKDVMHIDYETIVQLLLDHGADINVTRLNGNPPLMELIGPMACSEYAFEYLVARGANMFQANRIGMTPIAAFKRWGKKWQMAGERIFETYYEIDADTGEIQRKTTT